MSTHSFGGVWTERKLSVVRRYLERYAQALKDQPFQRIYIDAFAGTGGRTDKQRETLPLLDIPEFEAVLKDRRVSRLRSNRRFITMCLLNARLGGRAN
jgi:three-Cys-motif partner protein